MEVPIVQTLRSSTLVVVASAFLVLSACSDVVRLPDCVDCRPVEMAIDATFEAELGSSRAVSDDPDAFEWTVTESGTLDLVSVKRGERSEDEDEFIGGYSTYAVFTFRPTEAGTTEVQFALRAVDGSGASSVETLEVTVIVHE